MLSVEDNVLLSQTGKGTPMGELLRRHWHPIAAVTEFGDKATKQVRLLSEDLVLYKDRSGTYGLLALHCAHRRADLSYGFVEECGLRCSYHGWAYDEAGNCTSAPFEDSSSGSTRFRDHIKQPAYPVQEMAGLLFAYLGPLPAPVLPRWEVFDYKNGFAQIVLAPLDCNWLQAAENDIDPVHFEWLHNNWSRKQLDPDAPPAPSTCSSTF
jgi:5,5'-dehydrodivanillate O-demethylase